MVVNNKQYQKEYREKNKELLQEKDRERNRIRYANKTLEQKQKQIEASKISYLKNREKVLKRSRERHLKINYNLTSQQYLEKVVLQNNCCAVCNKPEHRITKTGDIKPVSVDHDHFTGKVRELLCNDCNAFLGFANENIEVLSNAIKYLQKHI